MTKRLGYTVKELAQSLGVSDQLVRESILRKKLPAWKLGDRQIIPAEYVERMNAEAMERAEQTEAA